VAVRGDLDVTGAADAREAIAALVVLGRCLLIAMSALDFIDCGSLGALLRVQRLAWSTGGEVVVAAPQRHVLRLLALTGRDHAFLIHASVQAAVAALPGRGARYGGRWFSPAMLCPRLPSTAAA
jgi:anti-sigma B factor antagonist